VLAALLRSDAQPSLWWGSPVECQSALYRHHRDGHLPEAPLGDGLHRLARFVEQATIVIPTSFLRDRAGTLIAIHPLRAGDALQLAAALTWRDDAPDGRTAFVSLDRRLREAASREGFTLLP
jgi:hypothetical protein